MTFTDFCERMLLALYQDGHVSNAWLPLGELQKRYGLEADPSWLSRAMNHLKAQQRIDGRETGGSPDTVVGRITGSGMAYIEGKYGSKDGVGQVLSPVSTSDEETMSFAAEDGSLVSTVDGKTLIVRSTPKQSVTTSIPSSAWTGLPTDYELTDARRTSLYRAITQAESDLDLLGASNMEKAQARAYIVAVRALSDAPEPPAEVIWNIINKAAAIASLASLFMPLLQAFVQ